METREKISRREMLAGSALGLATLTFCGVETAGHFAIADEFQSEADMQDSGGAVGLHGDAAAQYGFVMNVQLCVNCGECVDACRRENHTAVSKPRRKVSSYRTREGEELYVSTACMHCEKPSCAEVCPARAIRKEAGGVVVVDKGLCIGCKYCYQACPFEVPQYDAISMDKCDFCFGAGVALGDSPYCVRACKTQALRSGKIEDILSLSNRVKRVAGPTEPSAALV